MKKKIKLKAPDALVLIVVLLVVASILTYILPAGEYNRTIDPITQAEVVNPNSFHKVEKSPVSPWGILKSVPQGLNESADIINFLLIIGGFFGVLKGTGALDSLLKSAIINLKGKEKLVISIVLTFWGLGGAIIGNFEECLAFLPLQITLCLALGFDSITGVALGMCGVGIGYIGAILNPFTVATAQKIANVPLYSGMGIRVISFIALLIVTIVYIYRYVGKIHTNPELSLVYTEDLSSPYKENDLLSEDVHFTKKHKLVLLAFLLTIILLVYGVINYDFYLPEIAAVFVGSGIIMGLISGLSVNKIAEEFVKGASNMLYPALCVGFARAITIIMIEGNILDVIVKNFSKLVAGLPLQISAVGMYVFQSIINIFIPSGTGQAVVSMPIMTPLADVTGLTRQTACLAFQFGDGITNLITPTAGDLMAAIAIGGISYGKWMKWFYKLLLIWFVVCSIILIIATAISYGPI